MNEDYLWDKTGEDLEIKKLENALQAFRYKETAPPVIPVKISVIENAASQKSFDWRQWRFAFASAACFGLILVLAISIWFQFSMTIPNDVVVNITRPNALVSPGESFVDLPVITPIVEKTTPKEIKQIAQRKIYKVRKTAPFAVKPNLLMAKHVKKTNPTDVLTKEELYAYNQLMTALSVTSSQLRLVRDKIQGIENQTAIVKGER